MNTIKLKKFLKKYWVYIPEICFISLFLILIGRFTHIFLDKETLHFDAIIIVAFIISLTLLACLVGQFRWKNLYLSIFLSVLLGLGSFYMLLAVLSEFSEFPSKDPEGLRLLLVGSLIFIPLSIMALIMPIKYVNR